jgi:hypothetical protein
MGVRSRVDYYRVRRDPGTTGGQTLPIAFQLAGSRNSAVKSPSSYAAFGRRSLRPLNSNAARNRVRETGRLPHVEPVDKVSDIAKAGTPQQAGRDRTAIAPPCSAPPEVSRGPIRLSVTSVLLAGCTPISRSLRHSVLPAHTRPARRSGPAPVPAVR